MYLSRNNLLLCLFGTLPYFLVTTVAREVIVGGEVADHNDFQYQVALRYNHFRDYHCGGGIISYLHVLTAAHCVFKNDGVINHRPLSILAGTNNLDGTDAGAVIISVWKISVPRDYVHSVIASVSDIAVLTLRQSLIISKHGHLKSLKLPTNKQESYTGAIVNIAGYGWNWIQTHGNKETGGRNGTQLRFAKAVVLTQIQDGYPDIVAPEKQIGAKIKQDGASRPRGTCIGDGGGPLTYVKKFGRYQSITIIGVLVSSPFGCSEKDDGAIYTRVSNYLDFINNVISDEDPSYVITVFLN